MPTAIKVPRAKNLCSTRIKHKQLGVVLSKQRPVLASVGAGDRSLDRALNDFGFGKAKTVAFVGEDRSPHFHTLPTKFREDPGLRTRFRSCLAKVQRVIRLFTRQMERQWRYTSVRGALKPRAELLY